jgi:hypothetical protein
MSFMGSGVIIVTMEMIYQEIRKTGKEMRGIS